MIHRKRHPEFVEGCWACRISSVQVSPSATPSRSTEAAELVAKEKRWNADMAAYKALREQGLQPKRIDGSAALQAGATTRYEVEMAGRVMDPRDAKLAESVHAEVSASQAA